MEPIDRRAALQVLAAHLETLKQEYDIAAIAVFGSIARDEGDENSDVDILVTFTRAPGLFRFMDLQAFLESILGRRVDLATERALRPALRERILAEAIGVE